MRRRACWSRCALLCRLRAPRWYRSPSSATRDEDQPDDEHREDDVATLFGGCLGGRGAANAASIGGDSTRRVGRAPRARRRPPRRRRPTREAPRAALASPRSRERSARRVETARAQQRRGRRPGGTVAVAPVGARLRAQRDQLGEIGDGRDVAGLGDADEPVRVQVVAEQERGVAVRRREEPRAAVVDEVALVDRLQPERVLRGRRAARRPASCSRSASGRSASAQSGLSAAAASAISSHTAGDAIRAPLAAFGGSSSTSTGTSGPPSSQRSSSTRSRKNSQIARAAGHRRERDEHAGDAVQLAAGEEAEDDEQRMEPQRARHHVRDDDVPLHLVDEEEEDPDPDDAPRRIGEERVDRRRHGRQPRPDVRDHLDEGRPQTEEERVLAPRPRRDRSRRGCTCRRRRSSR